MTPKSVCPYSSLQVESRAVAATRSCWPLAKRVISSLLLALLAVAGPGMLCAQNKKPGLDLMDLSLEDLMAVKVTSVSKKEQRLSETPASIYVITRDEVRRSGASNIPDLLRMVPGLQVAQIDANIWAIGTRGFNERFSNKMLVMIDGRSVYSPLFGGVYWDSQDVVLEDIERIEVIRGPGGSLWGANAVNGIINIITKPAESTQGTLLTAGTGTLEPASATVRYGGKVGGIGFYRAFSTYTKNAGGADASGGPTPDGGHLLHGGFRSDLQLRKQDSLTVQGDLYSGSFGELLNLPIFTAPYAQTSPGVIQPAGGNLLGRWTHTLSSGARTELQAYYSLDDRDATERPDRRRTADIDFQNHFHFHERHDVVWGLGYRLYQMNMPATAYLSYTPGKQSETLFSAFLQDEYSLRPDRLHLTAGIKLEHNPYTGLEGQPSVGLVWTPAASQTIWVAVSRAVKTPSILNLSMQRPLSVDPGPDGLVLTTLVGNPNYKSENLLAYEGGYRLQLSRRFSIDATGFVNSYDHVETNETLPDQIPPQANPSYTMAPTQWANNLFGTAYGAETVATWSVVPRWSLSGTYSWLKLKMRQNAASNDLSTGPSFNGEAPTNQFGARSSLRLCKNVDLNTWSEYVGGLLADQVPSYVRLDSNLQWHTGEYTRIEVGGQNLLTPHHPEFLVGNGAIATEVRRSFFVRMTLAF
jgi:iron complex outermembrane recepter protein